MNPYDDLVARVRGAYTEYDHLVMRLRRRSLRTTERLNRTLQVLQHRVSEPRDGLQSFAQAGEFALGVVLFLVDRVVPGDRRGGVLTSW